MSYQYLIASSSAEDKTNLIIENQAKNSQKINEGQEDIKVLLATQARDSIQSNSITILLTLGFATVCLYFVYTRHIGPKLDKAWRKFADYLDAQNANLSALVVSNGKMSSDLIEHRVITKEYVKELNAKLVVIESKIESNKLEILEIKMLLELTKKENK